VDIIDGRVDVTENGNVTTFDDLPNAALTLHYGEDRLRDQVDIIDGFFDWDEDGSITSWDDFKDVLLLVP
jgi:hypothetical protein